MVLYETCDICESKKTSMICGECEFKVCETHSDNFTTCATCEKSLCDECNIVCDICGYRYCSECISNAEDDNICKECFNK